MPSLSPSADSNGSSHDSSRPRSRQIALKLSAYTRRSPRPAGHRPAGSLVRATFEHVGHDRACRVHSSAFRPCSPNPAAICSMVGSRIFMVPSTVTRWDFEGCRWVPYGADGSMGSMGSMGAQRCRWIEGTLVSTMGSARPPASNEGLPSYRPALRRERRARGGNPAGLTNLRNLARRGSLARTRSERWIQNLRNLRDLRRSRRCGRSPCRGLLRRSRGGCSCASRA